MTKGQPFTAGPSAEQLTLNMEPITISRVNPIFNMPIQPLCPEYKINFRTFKPEPGGLTRKINYVSLLAISAPTIERSTPTPGVCHSGIPTPQANLFFSPKTGWVSAEPLQSLNPAVLNNTTNKYVP